MPAQPLPARPTDLPIAEPGSLGKGGVPLRVVKADACPVKVDERTYYPHRGEFVVLLPAMSVGEYAMIAGLSDLGAKLAAAKGEPDENQQTTALISGQFAELTQLLAARVVAWSLTDALGRPIAPWTHRTAKGEPYAVLSGDPAPLRRLSAEELYWLLSGSEGETREQEKKGSSRSRTTSSASM